MHEHSNHYLVKEALKSLARASKSRYLDVKQSFIDGDKETTFYFWQFFYRANPHRAKGVDYCHTCKKFYLEFYFPRQPWTFENELKECERRAKALN